MKFIIGALTLAVVPLSACGAPSDTPNQVSTEDLNQFVANDTFTSDIAPPAEPAVPDEANAVTEPQPKDASSQARPERPAAPARLERTSPPAKARPAPLPAADPHAGHDMSEMGNMANMSH